MLPPHHGTLRTPPAPVPPSYSLASTSTAPTLCRSFSCSRLTTSSPSLSPSPLTSMVLMLVLLILLWQGGEPCAGLLVWDVICRFACKRKSVSVSHPDCSDNWACLETARAERFISAPCTKSSYMGLLGGKVQSGIFKKNIHSGWRGQFEFHATNEGDVSS